MAHNVCGFVQAILSLGFIRQTGLTQNRLLNAVFPVCGEFKN